MPENENNYKYLTNDANSPYVYVVASPEPVTVAQRTQYFDTKMCPLDDFVPGEERLH